ncbi:MAG: hypothetical protein AAF081_12640 [Actinomycetota bacterium]
MTGEPDTLDPLPIEPARRTRRPSGRTDRPINRRVLIALGLVALVAVGLSARGGDETPPSAADDGGTAEPSPVSTDGEPPPPAFAPARPEIPAPEITGGRGYSLFAALDAVATAEPNTRLADGQQITVTAEDPFLSTDDAAYALCRVGADNACTDLEGTGGEQPGANSVAVPVPRRFTDWRGDHHDCVDGAGCEIRLWAPASSIVELSIPITFDISADPRPPLEPEIDIEYAGLRTAVNLTVQGTTGFSVLACSDEASGACTDEPLFSTFGPLEGAEFAFTVDRLLLTPRGPHDCVTDGPCELRFRTDDGRMVAPVPVGFDPAVALERPRIDVRPATDLADGALVEIRTSRVDADIVAYSLCVPERFFCARFDSARADEPLVRRLPRFLEVRSWGTGGGRVIDCAIEQCVLRATGAGTVVDVPVGFDDDLPGRPPAEIGIAGTADLFRPGDEVTIAVRGLFVADPDPSSHTPATVRLCEEPQISATRCVNAIGDGDGVGPDGRFETTLLLPNFDRRRSRANPGRTSFCSKTCWVVVSTGLATPGAVLPIEIETPAEAQD